MSIGQTESAKAKRIAFLVNSVEYKYYTDILSGMLNEARNQNVLLNIFVGGSLIPSRQFITGENLLYSHVTEKNTDAVIILGDLGREISRTQFEEFCRSYENLPRMVIDYPIEGADMIEVDVRRGIYEMMDHLIEHHGYKSIACISGPEDNYQARIRTQAYIESLERHGIPLNQDLVVAGDFGYPSGIRAVEILIDDRKLDVDAIFAISDGMAVAAYDALLERDLRVPEDIALVTFNDTADLMFHSTPMTTVSQDLPAQGRLALRNILDRIDHPDSNPPRFVETKMVKRESCGCAKFLPGISESADGLAAGNDESRNLPDLLEEYLEEYKNPEPGLSPFGRPLGFEKNASDLLNAFRAELSPGEDADGASMATLRHISSGIRSFFEMSMYLEFLIGLHHRAHSTIKRGDAMLEGLDTLIHQGMTFLNRSIQRRYSGREQDLQTMMLGLKYFSQDVNSSKNILSLRTYISKHLPGLGIGRFVLAIYGSGWFDIEAREDLPHELKIVIAGNQAGEITIDPSESMVPSDEFMANPIFPVNETRTMLLFPLYFRREHYGIIAMEYSAQVHGIMYNMIPGLISSALNTIFTLNNLQNMKLQVSSTSKMAALGEMTSGISHELRNPLNSIINFAMLDMESLKDLEKMITDPANKINKEQKSEILEEIATLKSSAESIHRQSSQANSIIGGILKQARGDQGIIETGSINDILEEQIQLVYHSYRSKFPDFQFAISKDLYRNLPSYRGNLTQIGRAVLNLLSNAVDALRYRQAKDPNFEPQLVINSEMKNHRIFIRISDNGTGIEPEIQKRIFEPFFSTKPSSEGTGLGLGMTHDIIVEAHGGEVRCESEIGVGTTFTIIL
jgi:signal transduction histidine kinase/DNA-binding LacI/PurR family transcriptional regulator